RPSNRRNTPFDGVTTVSPSRLLREVFPIRPCSSYTSVKSVRLMATRLPCQFSTKDLRPWLAETGIDSSTPNRMTSVVFLMCGCAGIAALRARQELHRSARLQRREKLRRRAPSRLQDEGCDYRIVSAGAPARVARTATASRR